MTELGHRWYPTTVGEVERGLRSVTVDELVGLALIMQVSVPALMDVTGPEGRDETPIDFGLKQPVNPRVIWSTISGDRPEVTVQWIDNKVKNFGSFYTVETAKWAEEEESLAPGWSEDLEEGE